MSASNDNAATPSPLHARECEAVDVLVEHGFDLALAMRARPDLAAEMQSMHGTMGELDAYATGEPDPDLIALTLARVDRAAREQSDRMNISSARASGGSGQWRDIVAIAAVALLVVSVAVPVLSYVKSQQAIAGCSANLSRVAGATEGFYNDHSALPMAAGFMLPDGLMPNGNAHEFHASDCLDRLVAGGYCKSECLACASDHETEPNYAVQMASPKHPIHWRSGVRRPLIADRNPLTDFLRSGGTVTVIALHSRTHGSSGQNVLFTDASVEFLTTTAVDVGGKLDQLYVPRDHGGLEDDVGSFAEWVGSDTFLTQ